MKQILYISSLSSKRLINEIHKKTGADPGFAVQKFNRNIVHGIIQNGINIEIYSKPPKNNVVGCSWVSTPSEVEEGLQYNYVNFFNFPFLKDICVFLNTFWKVLVFGLSNRKRKAVVCDILAISMNMGAILASKLVGIKIVGIVTDMPGLMVGGLENSKSFLERIKTKINLSYIRSYTHYVFLTEQMNEVINTRHRPYIVMEALCDNVLSTFPATSFVKAEPKIIMYAGGMHQRYGVKMLVEAFRKIERNDIKLVLLGSGPYVNELQQVVKEDSRVEYRGVLTNEEVILLELESTLLVNPRPTTEEFTKYSFPSKNIEYMSSGTPLLTTKLPGMPKDYYPYIYLLEDESVEGYTNTLCAVLSIAEDILREKGQSAREYVLKNKNLKVQTSRILHLIGS